VFSPTAPPLLCLWFEFLYGLGCFFFGGVLGVLWFILLLVVLGLVWLCCFWGVWLFFFFWVVFLWSVCVLSA